ncbi:MAG: DUF2911 domain-containing protein [Bacteroidota bacterium]
MTRSLPILLTLFVAVAACAQDAPASGDAMMEDEMEMTAAPARANDEVRPSPNAAVSQTIGTTVVDIHYGRPSLRERSVFTSGAELAPAGAVWRTGANEAPTFTTSAPVMIEGETLPAGTYALFTIPGDDAWTVIFNTTAQQWGAFRYDEAEDALRVTVTPVNGVPMQEQFQIRFENAGADSATMLLHWGTVGVPVAISAAG